MLPAKEDDNDHEWAANKGLTSALKRNPQFCDWIATQTCSSGAFFIRPFKVQTITWTVKLPT